MGLIKYVRFNYQGKFGAVGSAEVDQRDLGEESLKMLTVPFK